MFNVSVILSAYFLLLALLFASALLIMGRDSLQRNKNVCLISHVLEFYLRGRVGAWTVLTALKPPWKNSALWPLPTQPLTGLKCN